MKKPTTPQEQFSLNVEVSRKQATLVADSHGEFDPSWLTATQAETLYNRRWDKETYIKAWNSALQTQTVADDAPLG